MALTRKETDEIIKNKSLRAASSRRTATKIIVLVLIAALILTGGAYGVMTIIDINTMTVSVSDSKKDGMSLSETEDFAEMTTVLDMNGPEEMDAYTYTFFDIEKEIIGLEGAHHGDKFIAYSFFLKNVNLTQSCTYTMGIKIAKDTKNVAAALRIMVIESDINNQNELENVMIYAKSKNDGTAEYVSYNDCTENQVPVTLENLNDSYTLLTTNVATPFIGEVVEDEESLGYYVMRDKGKTLEYNSYRKYTIVMWLEGTDLQCVNDILGGRCSIQVEFNIEEYSRPEHY